MKLALLIAFAFSGLATATEAQTIWVDIANNGFEDGSAGNPYNTVQEGVDAATAGGTVRVVGGTYTEIGVVIDKDITLEGDDDFTTLMIHAEVSGRFFIFESINSNPTVRNFVFVGDDDLATEETAFGNDNSTTVATLMTMEHCIVKDFQAGTQVNHTARIGSMEINYCTFVNNQCATQDNNANEIRISNCIFEGNEVAMCWLDTNCYEVHYSLFDGNTHNRRRTYMPGSIEDGVTQPRFGRGNVEGVASLDALCMPTCGSCARDMANPNDPFGNEPPGNGGRADAGATGNTVWAPVGCAGPPAGPCTAIPVEIDAGGGSRRWYSMKF